MNEAPEELVVIIDDDHGMREALQALVESIGREARTFVSAEEFLANATPFDVPYCIILDVRMPGRSGLDLQSELVRLTNPPPIIFLTAHSDVPMSVRAMKGGAIEFLEKPFRDSDLIDAILTALDRARTDQSEYRVTEELRARYQSLTPRVREVMDLVVRGMPNKQISWELGISEITVKVHRASAMKKMKAKSLADLVRMADKLSCSFLFFTVNQLAANLT